MTLRKILVTGSSGTIGTRLVERMLSDTDYAVTGVDKRPNAWSEAVQKLTVVGNLLDVATFDKLPRDLDAVIHLAANARVHDLVVDPSQARDNMNSVFNVLEFCRENRIPRVLFASSREVYGNLDGAKHAEWPVHLHGCESPYAASKMAGEALVYSYQRCYGLDFINFRFSNVYGMYDDSPRVVPLFIKLTRRNEDLTVFGKDKLLDFTYIDDAVTGVLQALERFERARNQVYNLSGNQPSSILAVAEMIRERLGGTNAIQIGEVRTGEVVQYIADLTSAKEQLRYQPKVAIAEGLDRSVDWYTRHVPA